MRLGFAKALGAAGVLIVTALVGGTLIGSALAVGDETDTGSSGVLATETGEYCDVYLDTLASELGTTRDELVAAGQAAANATIDAAVANGDLSEERAAEMRERIAEFEGEGCRWFGPGFRAHHAAGFVRGFVGANTLDAAAEALGLSEAELGAALREEGSLEAVVEAEGGDYATVSAAVLTSIEAELDAAVAEGTITQERADSIVEKVTTWLDEGGEVPSRPHRGPWGDDRDDDADGSDEEDGEGEEGDGA